MADFRDIKSVKELSQYWYDRRGLAHQTEPEKLAHAAFYAGFNMAVNVASWHQGDEEAMYADWRRLLHIPGMTCCP